MLVNSHIHNISPGDVTPAIMQQRRLRMSLSLRASKNQKGVTLLESLVAIVIMALGIMGIVGVQLRTLTDTQTSVRRAQAIRLIDDLGERMKVNPSAITNIDAYVMGWATGTGVPMTSQATSNCSTSNCSNSQIAAYDIREWKRAVERTLPMGNANTFLSTADPVTNQRQLGILLRWRENERSDAGTDFKDAINVGASRNADGSVSTTDAQSCPAGFTCHLQYIPISSRCVPDFRGGATAQFFCPGA